MSQEKAKEQSKLDEEEDDRFKPEEGIMSKSRSRSKASRSNSRRRSGSRSRSRSLSRSRKPTASENPRRIWVGGLHDRCEERDLQDVFEKFGKITDIKLRSSRRDVFAFIEFEDEKSAKGAINSVDQKSVRGNRVKVSWAQFKGSESSDVKPHRIRNKKNQVWIGHLKRNDEKQLQEAFEKFGEIRDLKIRSNRQDLFAFVEYTTPEACDKAIDNMNGADFMEGKIRVAWAQDKNSPGYSRGHSPKRRRHSRSRSPRGHRRRRSRSYSRGGYGSPRRRRTNSRSPRRRRSYSRGRGGRNNTGVPKGDYKLEIENLPSDMTWMDLKSMGKKYGGSESVTFARTWDEGRVHLGILEFTDRRSMIKAKDSLHGHRINGHKVFAKEIYR